jgi:hypothetical protein
VERIVHALTVFASCNNEGSCIDEHIVKDRGGSNIRKYNNCANGGEIKVDDPVLAQAELIYALLVGEYRHIKVKRIIVKEGSCPFGTRCMFN